MDVGAIGFVQLESAIVLVGLESAFAKRAVGISCLGMDVGAIAFDDGCWCDRTCSIGECDRFW